MRERVHFEEQIVVRVPQAVAFRGFVDVARYPEWQRMVRRVLELSGPGDASGTTYVLDHGPFMKLRVTVLETHYPDLVKLRQQGLGSVQEIAVSFAVGPSSSTTVRLSIDVTPLRILSRTGLNSGSRFAQRAIRSELERFGSWVERDYAASALEQN